MSDDELYNKHYKYLIINELDGNVQILSNMKDIIEYVNGFYSDESRQTSAPTLSRRLREKDYFKFYDIIIKELSW